MALALGVGAVRKTRGGMDPAVHGSRGGPESGRSAPACAARRARTPQCAARSRLRNESAKCEEEMNGVQCAMHRSSKLSRRHRSGDAGDAGGAVPLSRCMPCHVTRGRSRVLMRGLGENSQQTKYAQAQMGRHTMRTQEHVHITISAVPIRSAPSCWVGDTGYASELCSVCTGDTRQLHWSHWRYPDVQGSFSGAGWNLPAAPHPSASPARCL